MAFASCYTVALFLVTVFGCIPTSDIWNLYPTGRCTGAHGRLVVIYASGTLNISTNILLLIFAIPKIYSPVIGHVSIMVIIAAILRMVLSAKTQHSKDFSWDGIDIAVWTGVEVNAGLFCASAPAIKPLLRKFAPSLLSSSSGKRTSYNCSGKGAYGQGSRFDLQTEPRKKGSAVLTNKAWRGDVSPGGDSESERRVLGTIDEPGSIRKTVDVTFSEQRQETAD
ncbi:hypothetical protein LSUB1_G006802 [Lachnellula subtilissima]|uniref:Rhodopsin domain-containing protein n=1 Tax=Lachnellula subtilissima TaxID=602034 RepID=A0A8H8REE6_9HELO|nr:hypothetical protein LSUB1_G006802 [Lachnellula subtilissima]